MSNLPPCETAQGCPAHTSRIASMENAACHIKVEAYERAGQTLSSLICPAMAPLPSSQKESK